MTIKELRNSTGLSQDRFSERYGIPRRTVEDWETGKRTPPEYVLDMLTFVVESEGVNHKAWVFYEYRDRTGTGSYELFTDRDAAIAYAKNLWDSMTEYDQQSYLNDPVGNYIVAEMDVEWDSIEEKFVPSLNEYTPVWQKSLSPEECTLK
jgi:transcriptional regulator with XRE-family HTH domain